VGHLDAFVEKVVVESPEKAVGYTVAIEPEAVLEGLRPFGQWKWTPKGTAEKGCLGCLNGL